MMASAVATVRSCSVHPHSLHAYRVLSLQAQSPHTPFPRDFTQVRCNLDAPLPSIHRPDPLHPAEVVANVIFNQCRQSGDHGPINSWDRQLFWTDVRDGPGAPGWNPAYTDVSKNVIIANYGGSQVPAALHATTRQANRACSPALN